MPDILTWAFLGSVIGVSGVVGGMGLFISAGFTDDDPAFSIRFLGGLTILFISAIIMVFSLIELSLIEL